MGMFTLFFLPYEEVRNVFVFSSKMFFFFCAFCDWLTSYVAHMGDGGGMGGMPLP